MKKILKYQNVLMYYINILLFSSLTFCKEEIFISVIKEGIKEQFIPSNAIIITQKDIEKTSAKNLGELLDMLTVYDLSHYSGLGSEKSLRLRNSTSNQVLVLINGIPISGPAKGSFNLSLIPVEVIEKIEILSGSSSGLYGANAVAGVINIITKTSSKIHPEVYSCFSYGSFNTYGTTAEFDYVKDAYGIKILASGIHSDGWRENSKYDSISGYGKFSKQTLYGKVDFEILTKDSKSGIPGISPLPMEQWDGEKEKQASTPYALEYDNFSLFSLNFNNKLITSKLSYDIRKLIYDNSKDPLWPEKTDSNLNTINFLNEIALPYKIYVSLNYTYTLLNQQYPLNSNHNFKKDVSNLSLGLKKELNFESFNFIPIFRWDSNSIFGNKVSPQLIFVYGLKNLKFTLTAGTSWRAPTFLDLYWPDQIWAKGNPDLKPEDSYSLDFAFEFKPEKFRVSINPFYRYIRNQIRWYPENPQDMFSAWIPSNVDETVAQGVEINSEFSVRNIFINKVSVLLCDNRIKKKGEEDKGWQKQAYSPLVSAVYNFEVLLPYSFKLANVIKYVDSQYSRDSESGTKLKSFILWDIKFSKNIFNFLDLYLQAKDVLDQKGVNREAYPQPGRSYECGFCLNVKF
ncbi:MAG: TonB-dependent receptor [Endomicrobiia bacterium]